MRRLELLVSGAMAPLLSGCFYFGGGDTAQSVEDACPGVRLAVESADTGVTVKWDGSTEYPVARIKNFIPGQKDPVTLIQVANDDQVVVPNLAPATSYTLGVYCAETFEATTERKSAKRLFVTTRSEALPWSPGLKSVVPEPGTGGTKRLLLTFEPARGVYGQPVLGYQVYLAKVSAVAAPEDIFNGNPVQADGAITDPDVNGYFLNGGNLRSAAVSGLDPGTAYYVGLRAVQRVTANGNTMTLYERNVIVRKVSTIGYDPNLPACVLSSVSPGSGDPALSQTVTLNGQNFLPDSTVTVAGAPCANYNFVSATTATCTLPAGALGFATVAMSQPHGKSCQLPDGYIYSNLGSPAAGGIAPSRGPTSGGQVVTITGVNFAMFGPGGYSGSVRIGTSSCTINGALTNSTTIVCTTTTGTNGVKDVVIRNWDRKETTMPAAYTYQGPPSVTSFTPTLGYQGGATLITMVGNNFFPGITVRMDPSGTPAFCAITILTQTSLQCLTSAHAPGDVFVRVENTDGQWVQASQQFRYTLTQAPIVQAVDPTLGSTSGNTSVRITGDNLLNGSTVRFGKPGSWATASGCSYNPPLEIVCSTPARAPGAVDIEVTLPDTQKGSGVDLFTYVTTPDPVVTSVSPAIGHTSGGTNVTVFGSGFSSASVRIGGVNCGVLSQTSTQINCVTGPHAAGLVEAMVINGNGQRGTRAGVYTYTSAFPPSISLITPSTVDNSGGTVITVNGSSFQAGLTAIIVGVGSCPTSGVTASSFTCTVPSTLLTGAFDFRVTNPDGQTDTKVGGLTYLGPFDIYGILPTAGSMNGGTSITITGDGFVAGSVVTVGGVACAITSMTMNQIVCTTGARTPGVTDVSVTRPGPQTVTKVNVFTYNPALYLTNVRPNEGVTAGTTLVIEGAGFVAGATVLVNGSVCSAPTVLSPRRLQCTAPAAVANTVADVVVTLPDTQSRRLRRFVRYGTSWACNTVSTLAGFKSAWGPEDGGPGVHRLDEPVGLSFVGGELYFVEKAGSRLRKVNLTTGNVSTVVGSYRVSQQVDDPSGNGLLRSPASMTSIGSQIFLTSNSHYLYTPDPERSVRRFDTSTGALTTIFADTNLIDTTKITTDGTSLFVGSSWATFSVDPFSGAGSSLGAGFNSSRGFVFALGNLFRNEGLYDTLVRLAVPSMSVVSNWSTGGSGCSSIQDGSTGSARNCNNALIQRGTGLLAYDSARLRTISSTGTFLTVAGAATVGWLDGSGTAARFASGQGQFATDGTYYYVAEADNHAIRRIDPATWDIVTVAGAYGSRPGTNDGTGSSARFQTPAGACTDGEFVYVVDRLGSALRRIDPVTGVTTTLTTALSAGMSCASDGNNLYVTSSRHVVYRVDGVTNAVTVLAGLLDQGGPTNGFGASARFAWPSAIASDGASLWVTDSNGIRRVNILTAEVTTYAGVPGGWVFLVGDQFAVLRDSYIDFYDITTGAFVRQIGPNLYWGDGAGVSGSNVYVSSQYSSAFRKVDMDTGVSNDVYFGSRGWEEDGSAASASWVVPRGVVWAQGKLIYGNGSNGVRQCVN